MLLIICANDRVCANDHAALSTEFRVNAVGGESANAKHHVCRIGQCVNNLVLRWQHEKAHVHARHISENMELLAKFDEAERAGDVDKLDGILCAFVDCPGSEQ